MTRPLTNIAASKRAKLEAMARAQGRSTELLFLLYMEERLLYRISQTSLSDKFVLKGGLLLYSLFGQRQGRPGTSTCWGSTCLSSRMNWPH